MCLCLISAPGGGTAHAIMCLRCRVKQHASRLRGTPPPLNLAQPKSRSCAGLLCDLASQNKRPPASRCLICQPTERAAVCNNRTLFTIHPCGGVQSHPHTHREWRPLKNHPLAVCCRRVRNIPGARRTELLSHRQKSSPLDSSFFRSPQKRPSSNTNRSPRRTLANRTWRSWPADALLGAVFMSKH